jgi:hypothetical protein
VQLPIFPEQATTMSERDRPSLIIFPPLLLLSTIVLAFALQWLVPLDLLARFDQTWRNVFGGGLLAAGRGADTGSGRAHC